MLRVYPRVGGETVLCWFLSCPTSGLSPRGRGNPCPVTGSSRTCGSIPAWAGKPATATSRPSPMRVYPRVGGETSDTTGTTNSIGGLSPRGRGNPQARVAEGHRKGSIPAWAGKPATAAPGCGSPLVYPRVGGETVSAAMSDRTMTGLSPRGRGNPAHRSGAERTGESIPAWAGKPGRSGPSLRT